MIDTIVLKLSNDMFFITDHDKFPPSARWLTDTQTGSFGGRAYIPSKQNPLKADLLNGIYKPRLTLTNRFNHTGRWEPSLKVELSLPKLLFGNNFDELQDCDFEPITNKLQQRLKEMGVRVLRP